MTLSPAFVQAVREGKVTAAEWNAKYPDPIPVRYWPMEREGPGIVSRTRSIAWELGSGHPVVKVEGKAGGIHLTHVEPIAEDKPDPTAEDKPDPTATYEYNGQQEAHRGKAFKYTDSMWIQDMVPVHAFEADDKTIVTLKTDRWQDVMKEVKR